MTDEVQQEPLRPGSKMKIAGGHVVEVVGFVPAGKNLRRILVNTEHGKSLQLPTDTQYELMPPLTPLKTVHDPRYMSKKV